MVDFSLLQTPDYLGALQKGLDQGRTSARRSRIEGALASYQANPDAAEGALIAAGAPEVAMSLGQMRRQKVQAEQQDLALKQQQDSIARRQAVGKLYATDPQGAQNAALAGGDTELAAQLQGLGAGQRKAALEHIDLVSHIADQIAGSTPDPKERAARAAHIAQANPELGITPEQAAQMDWSDAGVATMRAATGKAREQFSLNPGDQRYDETGKLIAQAPYAPVKLNEGEQLIDVNGPSASGGAPTPAPSGPAYAQVAQAAQAAGAKPEESAYLQRLAKVESSGDPKARNGSSTGIFQFHPDTFHNAGGADINSVEDQTKAALNLSRTYRQQLQEMHVEPTDANAYIMHQQGAGGGRALLTAPPEVNAVAALTPVYGSEKRARQAITGNGGTADMTAGQFTDMWRKKWSGSQGGAQSGPRVIAGAPSGDSSMSDATVEFQAQMYLRNGVLPPLGMGKAATQNRTRILNEAQKIAQQTGLTGPEAAARFATTKAANASLGKLTTLLSQISASEQTVARNADYMLTLAPKGAGGTNSPLLNAPIQKLREALGSSQVTQFNNAIGTVADEYAKVMSSSTGSGGVTSDSARREAYSRLNKSATLAQLQANIAAMKIEMANRIKSLREEQGNLQAIISGKAPAEAATPQTGWSIVGVK